MRNRTGASRPYPATLALWENRTCVGEVPVWGWRPQSRRPPPHSRGRWTFSWWTTSRWCGSTCGRCSPHSSTVSPRPAAPHTAPLKPASPIYAVCPPPIFIVLFLKKKILKIHDIMLQFSSCCTKIHQITSYCIFYITSRDMSLFCSGPTPPR